MTRNRVAGHRRTRPAPAPAEAPDHRRILELEHETGLVQRGEHYVDDPCPACLGHRPGDDLKRIRRQKAYEAAVASGRAYRPIYAMGDPLPIRILFADGQPAPDLDED